ncbi:MAG: serine hydrolase [Cyclobacteriaceae bacterium]|nr:serine hydrolase [Cyclobacteriaceae bacterium]UYN87161.1 MAG: serine hydrolase [Cyclobacteriaceae bacterium]
MKKKIVYALIILAVLSIAFASCSTKTYMGRWMKWRASDILDHEKFPNHPFDASPHPFSFIEATESRLADLMIETRKGKTELEKVLELSETTAFLVIKNDSLLYEGYFNGYSRESINTSFSVGKSITSLLLGKAIDDGLIESLTDTVTRYLPQLAQQDARYSKLTLSHLLNMRSGIQFKDHDLPWGDKPKAYYHPRLRERIYELPIKAEPGTAFKYNSYNPIVIGMVLEKACGQSPAEYFERNIWNKLGMEYSGSWSMDSDESRMMKMESGLNLRAIDFAKFGRLVLNNGKWNDEQVISEEWIEASTVVSPENHVPEFGNEIHYEKFWWLHSKDQKHAYIISGWGHLGQYLYIFPDEKIIIVRMGKDLGRVGSWKNIFLQVVDAVR